jgi:hypothetical protein
MSCHEVKAKGIDIIRETGKVSAWFDRSTGTHLSGLANLRSAGYV